MRIFKKKCYFFFVDFCNGAYRSLSSDGVVDARRRTRRESATVESSNARAADSSGASVATAPRRTADRIHSWTARLYSSWKTYSSSSSRSRSKHTSQVSPTSFHLS
jgi:hypothetical protein